MLPFVLAKNPASLASDTRVENITDNLSKSLEMSYLLRSRSPWIAIEASTPLAIVEQRERSISYASLSSLHTDTQLSDAQDHDHLLSNQPVQEESQSSLRSIGSLSRFYKKDVKLSTFRQSVFNATNSLLGVGLLSLPYTMRISGWIGIAVLVFFAVLTCHTGRILGRIMEYTPTVKLRDGAGAYTMYGFHDMGFVAFGEAGKLLISFFFILETFGYCCIYLVIEGDNLHHLLSSLPYFSGAGGGSEWRREDFMCLAAALFFPTVIIRNLNILSYMSGVGVLSSVLLLTGVLCTGMYPSQFPPSRTFCDADSGCTGSIMHPSPTVPARLAALPVTAGLVLVGFAGHAVFPTLRNDMVDKRLYSRMVNVTYAVATAAYVAMATAGYLMFGESAQQQVTLNLGVSVVSQMVVWIVAVNPMTKFALNLAPIVLGLEGILKLKFRLSDEDWTLWTASLLMRTIIVGSALIIVVAVPDFALVLGLMGSSCSFTISVAFPCLCYMKLYWAEMTYFDRAFNVVGAAIGIFGAVFGTIASFLNGGHEGG